MKPEVLFVTGNEWRRHDPVPHLLESMQPPVATVVLGYTMKDHCFDHQECKREIKWTQKCHMFGRKLGDIRFNFLIGGDAAVYECRGWLVRPSIPVKFQFTFDDCIYVAFMGRFSDEPPTEKMMKAYRWLLEYGIEHNLLTSDYNEIYLQQQLPDSGTGHRAHISAFIKDKGNMNFEPHKHVYD